MAWWEANQVHYVLGLARNARLQRAIGGALNEAKARCEATQAAVRIYQELDYRTHKTWTRARRVVAKAEHLPGKANPHFVVTSLPAERIAAAPLYEQLYCARGDMENRIKEQQLDLFADRTSTATMPTSSVGGSARWPTCSWPSCVARRSPAPRSRARRPARSGCGCSSSRRWCA